MSLTLEEKRIAELTQRVEDFLCEGEEFFVRCQDEEVEVVPAQQASALRKNHEELYGLLLSINSQLAGAANIPRWIVRLLAITFILALHLDWFAVLRLPFDLAKLQNYWVYGLVALFGYAINSVIHEWRQHQVYANRRAELMQLVQESELGKYRLLTQMEGDPLLPAVSHLLKKDNAQEARY